MRDFFSGEGVHVACVWITKSDEDDSRSFSARIMYLRTCLLSRYVERTDCSFCETVLDFATLRFMQQKKRAHQLSQKNLFGTNAAFLGKHDGQGQSTKASVQVILSLLLSLHDDICFCRQI